MKKILYFGLEDNYINAICEKLSEYSEDISIVTRFVTEQKDLPYLFAQIRSQEPSVVILDGEIFETIASKIFTVVKNSNLVNVDYFFLVSSEQSTIKLSAKEIAYGTMMHFYKSFEIKDIIYAIESLLLEEKAEEKDVVKAFYSSTIEIFTPTRVYHFDRNKAFIQSNIRYEKPVEVIDFPFYKEIFQSHKHKLTEGELRRYDGNFRYSYELEFLYYSKPMKSDKLKANYLECEYDLESKVVKADFFEKFLELEKKQKKTLLVQPDEDAEEPVALEDDYVMAPADLVSKRKAVFFNIMRDIGHNKVEGSINITVYDSTFELLKKEKFLFEDLKHNVILRFKPLNIKDELTKDRPELIGIYCNEENGIETAREILSNLVHIKNYFPYICLFNIPNAKDINAIRDGLQYHFVIASPGVAQSHFLSRVADIYKKKFYESEVNKSKKRIDRIFKENPGMEELNPKLDSPDLVEFYCDFSKNLDESTFFSALKVELISINEFEVVFKSSADILMGQIFKLNDPIDMHVVIVPHFKDSQESKIEGCYRGVLHFLKEVDKQAIRRYVNSIYTINNEDKSSLTTDEINRLKKQYFTSQK